MTTSRDAAASTSAPESPDAFRRRVRAMYALTPDARIQGLCPLDVNARNIDSYEQGRWELVTRDVAAALGDAVARDACAFLDDVGAIQDAFGIRTNAVNLKKVLLRTLEETQALEVRLRRLLTYYRGDMHKDRGYRAAARYREACAAHGRCRGAMQAICDARVYLKQICCVPRHPECHRPKRLATTPRTMISRGFVTRARAALGDASEDDAVVGYAFTREDETRPSLTHDFDRLVRRAREELRLPPHEIEFIVATLIARGVAKASVIREELVAFSTACARIRADAEALATRARRDHANPDDVVRERFTVVDETTGWLHASPSALEALQIAAKIDARVLALEGSAPALEETRRWIDEALDDPRRTLFAAGDDAHTASFVPDGFALGKMIKEYATTIERYEPDMLAELAGALASNDVAADGDAVERVARAEGKMRCARCDRSYSKLWISANTRACVVCEHDARQRGTCPTASACGSAFVCPHARACLRCERVSCDACGVSRGDAEDVAQLVETTRAFCVFLDFDRTMCATKAGASPLPANFRDLPEDALENAARRRAADAALLALARSHARAYVVTRNSHVEAIETYLRVHGVARPNVRRVMPGESKGPTIARALEEERLRAGEDVDVDAPSVFVDDDVRELLREDVRAMRGRLTCVVFTRDAS